MTNSTTLTSGPWPDTVPSTMYPGYVWDRYTKHIQYNWVVYSLIVDKQLLLKAFYTNDTGYGYVTVHEPYLDEVPRKQIEIPVTDAPPLKDFLHMAEMLYITTPK